MRNKLRFAAVVLSAFIAPAWAQSSVVGAAKPAFDQTSALAPSAGAQGDLKYRDPKDPLTLGEVAHMQRLKEAEDFLNKHGYTTIKPAEPAPEEKARQQVVEAPPSYLKVLAVYGKVTAPHAEVDHDGQTMAVTAGQRFGPYLIETIQSAGVTIQTSTACAPAQQHRRTKKAARACASADRLLSVGETVEWKR